MRVEPYGNLSAAQGGYFGDDSRILHRCGSDNNTTDSGLEQRGRIFTRPHTSAGLDLGSAAGRNRSQPADEVAIDRSFTSSTIEIDDMHPQSAGLDELLNDKFRSIAVNSSSFVIALRQPDKVPVEKINRREQFAGSLAVFVYIVSAHSLKHLGWCGRAQRTSARAQCRARQTSRDGTVYPSRCLARQAQ